jgi:hypothetical protein
MSYRKSKEHLRQMRRRAEVSKAAYHGKQDLALTYEQLGLRVPTKLKKAIDDKRCQLRYRGAL